MTTSTEAATPGATPRRPDAIQLEGVDHAFGSSQVLKDISFRVQQGEIFGLVGPSGSGKTTAVKVIVGLLEPSAGAVKVLGASPRDFRTSDRRQIGYMPQSFSLYPSLTVLENARFMANIYGVGWLARRRRIRDILTFLELWDARGRLAQHLSGGMQRRLSLAGAILHEPSLLVVDEPTAGLDPALRLRIWDYLRELQEHGTTIIVTTQYIEEAEHCDGVAVLSEGQLAAIGSPLDLRREADLPDLVVLEVSGANRGEAVDAVNRVAGVRSLEWDGGAGLTLRVDDMVATLPEIQAAIQAQGCSSTVVSSRQATFEEVFMRHTGQA